MNFIDVNKQRFHKLVWLLRRKYVSKAEKLPEGKLLFDWEHINYTRTDLIRSLLAAYPSDNYLEIGCQGNKNFNAVTAKKKTGVDPVSGGTHRLESDTFFAENKETFDFVFIDGLHTYEQARADVVHALACLGPGGIITIHDMLPSSWEREHVPRLNPIWNGTVWKIAYEIKERFGAKFGIVMANHGIGVIFNDITSYTPFAKEAPENIRNLSFDDFARDHKNFNLVPVSKVNEFIKRRGV